MQPVRKSTESIGSDDLLLIVEEEDVSKAGGDTSCGSWAHVTLVIPPQDVNRA
jgi:hypothetical protein